MFCQLKFCFLGGASYLNSKHRSQQNGDRPYVYADDCFGALCPWWLPAKDSSSTPEIDLQVSDGVECVGDCVEVIGEGSGEIKVEDDITVISSNDVSNSVAFPKTRYHVEGKHII